MNSDNYSNCECMHLCNKFCPTCTCHKTDCGRKVRIVRNMMNYYCTEHLRCGTSVKNEGPCEGCLITYQMESINQQNG